MIEFLVRRALISAVTLLLISVIVFTGVRMIPGDPARVLGGTDADAAGLEEIREKYGLNDPIPVQYLRWLALAARGDLGESIRTRTSVAWTIAIKAPITLELACLSLLVAVTIAIPIGVVAAVRRNTAWDVLASSVSLCGVSIPNFWLGIMLILLVSVRFGWLPASGFVPLGEDLVGNLKRMVMPSLVLGSGLAAVRRNTAWDVLASSVSLCGVSIPNFWLGIMLILLVSVRLGWLPASGFVPLGEDLVGNLKRMLMPALVLGSGLAAALMRQTRNAMIEVLSTDYVRTARAKGLAQPAVIIRHALRNGLIPVVTILGLQMGALMSGAVVTESIFVLPGFGRLIVEAVFTRDYPVVQGVVLLTASSYVLINLLVDVSYTVLNPRIRIRSTADGG